MDTTPQVIEEKFSGIDWALMNFVFVMAILADWVITIAQYVWQKVCQSSFGQFLAAPSPFVPAEDMAILRKIWAWLECPAPDRPDPIEDPNSLSSRVTRIVGMMAIAIAIIGLVAAWVITHN